MNGGRIPWKVAAICETFKISCLMRRHFMRGGSEYHSKARSFRFGVVVEYHPISSKDLSRLHQFGTKVLPGIFFGYVLCAVRIWKGDILVADIEELEKMDASEIHAQRLHANEVLTPTNGEHFIFPIAEGTVKLSGGDQVLRASTFIGDCATPRRRTRKSSRRIRRVFFNTTSRLIIV